MQTPSAAQAAEQIEPTRAKESRAMHRCEVRKRGGQVCGRYVATVFLDGLWRCPSHRPRNTVPRVPADPLKLPKPPVTDLKEPQDAVRLSSWAAVQLALGRLDYQRATAISNTCREFRQSYKAAQRADTDNALQEEFFAAMDRFFDARAADDDYAEQMAETDAKRILGKLLGKDAA